MFVPENSVEACLFYMKSQLKEKFSDSEIRRIQVEAFEARLGFSHSDLLLRKQDGLSESDLLFFRDIVKRLLKNEPFQHIIGSTYFCDLKLKTDKRALIPRPETEELVHHVVQWIQSKEIVDPIVLDLCTGSGCIALALKSYLPLATIVGTDVSNDALSLANENSSNLELNVHFYHSDVLNFNLPNEELAEKYDVIVSNPPYIPFSDLHDMDTNVIDHEPHLALFVENDDPLIFYRQLAQIASKHLRPEGLLAVEIHEKYARQTMALFENQGFINVTLLKDLQGKNRMVFAENV